MHMSDLLVFAEVCEPNLRDLITEVTGGIGHNLRCFNTHTDLVSAIGSGRLPRVMILAPPRLTAFEEDAYTALIRSHPTIPVTLLVRPGDSWRADRLKSAGNAKVLTMPVLRNDIESLLDSMPEPKACENYPGNIQELPVQRTAKRIPETSNGQLVLEELNERTFFLAASPAMLDIYRQVKLLRAIEASILILGESGTGKEVVAHLIHKHSRRAQQRFVNVNCAALPTELLESELFGHMKGAFTGAVTDRPGRFEQANGGTILLDEIGEISASMQAKLLHVLQDGQFTRLGAQRPTNVDVHVLAATNIAIEKALAEKTFREDLYYRLNTFTINVPPLRERVVEIPYLVREILLRAPQAQRSGINHFSSEMIELMRQYSWPGNLRELRNFVLRTVIIEDEPAAKQDLERRIAQAQSSRLRQRDAEFLSFSAPMRSVVRGVKERTETRMIENALDACGWNRRDAARVLDISYRALLYKIQQHGLHPRNQRMAG